MPKRSAGCFECRKRKVRCDESKPECNICLRRGTKCPGYRPTQSFVLHTFDKKSERPEIIREDDNQYRYANHREQESPNNGRAVVQLRASEARPVDAPLPRQVSPAAIDRVEYLSNFLNLYLPRWEGEELTPPSAMMLYLPSLPASRQVFLAALDAISMAQLAVANKNLPLIYRTRSLYGTALSLLMKSVSDTRGCQEDETMLATYMLGLYEVFVGVTGGHGFFYHVQGLLHILRQRGPNSLKTKLSMDIFHGVRYNSVAIGYRMRKASMLDSPEWLAVTTHAARSDAYVALIDICIHIPRLLERTDRLTHTNASPADFDQLIADSQAIANRGFAWHDAFMKKDPPPFTLMPADAMEGLLIKMDDMTFDHVYMFRTFASYTTLINYWMAILILRLNTFQLVRHPSQRLLEPKQLMLWDRELAGHADSICRAVPYGSRVQAGYSGRFGSLTPLVVAKKYFEATKRIKEAEWCEKVYYGTKVPGLYATPNIPMDVNPGMQNLMQRSQRYIL